MAASDRRSRSQRTAQDLLKRGFPHGKRMSSPRHSNYPNLSDVGSAAYRRLMKKRGSISTI